jgi:hypothetical protein
MSDPDDLLEGISAAEDAFSHAHGRPAFEPGINSAPDAADGEVQIQKACRLLELIGEIEEIGEYYGAILEHSFIIIERTFQGYLLAITGTDANELRDHSSPYEFARGQVPLETDTIDSLQRLYDGRRTDHYYGTTVTTEAQAERMCRVSSIVHDHIVSFDHELEQFCLCDLDD